MKKILIINDYITSFGWAEKVMFDIKRLLESKWYKVFLLGEKDKKNNLLSFFRRYFSFVYLYKTYKIIKENNIDIIHTHSVSRNISPSPIIVSKLLWKKIIMTVHDFHYYCPKTWWILRNWKECKIWFNSLCWLKNCNTQKKWLNNIPYHFLKWLKVWLHRLIIKKYVDTFICPSKKLQELMGKSLKIPKEKVIYLPNFIEIDKNYYPNFENINDNKFIYVWRISKEKWINIAIKAFDILVNKERLKDIYFEIIWGWPEKENLESLVKELNLENNIKFLWRVDNYKLKTNYENSIWLIMPSVCLENNPLVAIEWMKFWKPILASNVWGYPDLVENWKNGYLFKMWNHKELVEKIKLLYLNKDKSIEMWKYWFEKLKKEFGSEVFYEKLMDIYSIKKYQEN